MPQFGLCMIPASATNPHANSQNLCIMHNAQGSRDSACSINIPTDKRVPDKKSTDIARSSDEKSRIFKLNILVNVDYYFPSRSSLCKTIQRIGKLF